MPTATPSHMITWHQQSRDHFTRSTWFQLLNQPSILRSYGAAKILDSWSWPLGVTWRHRSRDHCIRDVSELFTVVLNPPIPTRLFKFPFLKFRYPYPFPYYSCKLIAIPTNSSYRAMHVVLARYCYRKSSVCLSVCLSVCNVAVRWAYRLD